MSTANGWHPVKRIDKHTESRSYFKFIIRNGETITFDTQYCRNCIFLKKPVSCRKNIIKHFVPDDPFFRMGIRFKINARRCAVNPKLKLKPEEWRPNWWRDKPKVKVSREAMVLWKALNKYAGKETEDGYLEINGYIDNKDMFRKAIHYGIITKNNSGKWVFVKPESEDIEEKEPDKKDKKKKNGFKL